MTVKLLRRLYAAFVFLLSTVILFLTVQSSVSFWDPGEISAASYSLMVPHPPGGPFWLMIGRIFSMIPFASNIGFRINTVSVLSGSLTILLLFLIIIKVIENYRGKDYKSISDAVLTYTSAAIGALAFNFCDTFWFNATEANYFALSTLLFALIIWLMMIWNEHSKEAGSEKYILLMAYLIGLSFGVHLMSVLALFTFVFVVVMKKYVTDDESFKKSAYIFLVHLGILLLIAVGMWASQTGTTPPTPQQYEAFDSRFIWIMIGASAVFMGIMWKRIYHRNSFYIPIAVAGITLMIAYPGIVKGVPALLLAIGGSSDFTSLFIFILLLGIIIYVIYWATKNKKNITNLSFKVLLFMLLGFTTYSMIIIRSNQSPPMNENSPSNFHKLMYYLDRQQYGNFPIFKRRFSSQQNQQGIYSNYSSDLDFLWRYQIEHMFNRYLGWNFIGKVSTVQDAGVKWSQFYGIPFFIGILGLFYLFKKDWKMATAFLILFIFMGYLIAFYQNQQQPQPRDRFYFYPGAFFVFAVWISVGMREGVEWLKEKIKSKSLVKTATYGFLILGILFIPGNMLRINYYLLDRSGNWLPWDFSYNLLQSCKPNAILFTGGDNDTFPLWYLQDVEGVRRDVRVVCLELANTPWYVYQLKNDSPYGAKKIKMSMSNAMIEQLGGIMRWNPQMISLPVSKEAIKEFNVKDSSVIKSGKITWLMKNTLQYGNVKAIRSQDVVVRDIIENNTWNRPIYFANTTGGPDADNHIGLGDYLKMEGLAYRLVPNKSIYGDDINTKITTEDLFNENPSYSKTYKPGFKFRGLNNKKVFFNAQERTLIFDYRSTFERLAYYYLNTLNNKAMCINTLNMLEKRMPGDVAPISYNMLYFIGNIYHSAGDTVKYKKYTDEFIKEATKRLDISIDEVNNPDNPYTMLERLYLNLKEYDKAIDIMEKLKTRFPQLTGIQEQINQIKLLKKQNNR